MSIVVVTTAKYYIARENSNAELTLKLSGCYTAKKNS